MLNIEEFEDLMYEDDIEYLDLEEPTQGIYFSVITEFNEEHHLVKRKTKDVYRESDPVSTHPQAVDIAKKLALKIRKSYQNSIIFNIPDDIREDIFSIYISDKNEENIARIGITAVDYRDVTIH